MASFSSLLTVSSQSEFDSTPPFGAHSAVRTSSRPATTIPSAPKSALVMPDQDDQVSSQRLKPFSCSVCGTGFARQSHLLRHRQSHLPEGQQRRVACNECGRSFSRYDVCLRHTRKVHRETRPEIQKGAAKSCQHCRHKKLRCDRRQPCKSCSQANCACVYIRRTSVGNRADNVGDERHSTYPEPGIRPQLINSIALDLPNVSASVGNEKHSTYPESEIRPQLTNSIVPDLPNVSTSVGNDLADVLHSTSMASFPPYLSDVSMDYEAMDIFGAIIPQTTQDSIYDTGLESYPLFPNRLPTTDESMASFWSDFTVSTENIHPLPMKTRLDPSTAALDLVSFGLESSGTVITSCDSTGYDGEPQPQQQQQYMSAVVHDNYNLEQITSPKQFSVDASRRQTDGRTHLPDPQSRKPEWPFDHTSYSEPYRCQLPPLREVLQRTIRPHSPRGEGTIKSLIQLLSSPRLPEMDHNRSFEEVSAINLLTRSLDLYIAEFHSILPFIHVPTFNINTCPTVLLAAMACIGALFSSRQESPEDSWSLSEMSTQMITWLGESDSTNHYKPAYISACILHQIYSLGSGDTKLYQNADGARGALFTGLHGMNLLGSSPNFESEEIEGQESQRPLLSQGVDFYSQWLSWRDLELNKRITWAAFEYDCSLCTLSGRRGAVDILELPSRLPCEESLWEARTAQAWAALVSHLPPKASNGVFLPRFLRNTLAGNPIPNDTPAWSKRLCAQIIGRLLWDLKQLHTLSLSNFLGLPALLAAQTQTKLVLLGSLMNLRDSMAHPTSTSDIIHLNITSLVCHYSHLYASEEMMDLVIFIFRVGARQRAKKSESELDNAKRRLSSLFAKNLRKTRTLVWHAAQIIAMAREYMVHAPCETMRVFMGHIFILAFAKFCPSELDLGVSDRPPLRLDQPTRTSDQKARVKIWVVHGGHAGIGSVPNINGNGCVEALKQEALLLMCELRVWKLADKFGRIIESFDSDEV